MKRSKPNGIQTPLFSSNGHSDKPVLITGGAGFIGTNVADRFLSAGHSVIIYDNISRAGVEQNLKWLQETHGSRVQIEVADMRDSANLRYAAKQASKVFHFAAQVAVTTSLTAPIDDFEINARGTLNLLEALRGLDNPPPLIFTSTNKVYGDLADVKIRDNGHRYEPENAELRQNGFSETRPLDFHSPYGCSKGAAEQYVLDYARTFKIPALVFRMSCIYGLHQFGNEDQGWVAHFLIRALEGKPITIYGDGKQVRDVLFIDDLVNAFLLAHEHMGELSGHAFNIGGGPQNTISLLELLGLIEEVNGQKPTAKFDAWRPADQQYYVSDIRKFSSMTGWSPKVSVREGVKRLYNWLLENRDFAPMDLNRLEHENIGLNEAKQMSVIQSQVLKQRREPRSKRLWEEANGNGVLTRNGKAARS
ncbi:MAG: SDR family NAD(P)-dependent oxidoreductase [Limisphaerales bacterium]